MTICRKMYDIIVCISIFYQLYITVQYIQLSITHLCIMYHVLTSMSLFLDRLTVMLYHCILRYASCTAVYNIHIASENALKKGRTSPSSLICASCRKQSYIGYIKPYVEGIKST